MSVGPIRYLFPWARVIIYNSSHPLGVRTGGSIFVRRQGVLVQLAALATVSAFIGGGLSRSLVKYLEGRARSVKEALEGPFT